MVPMFCIRKSSHEKSDNAKQKKVETNKSSISGI